MSNRFIGIYNSYKTSSKLVEIKNQIKNKPTIRSSISLDRKHWYSENAGLLNIGDTLHINTIDSGTDFLYVSYLENNNNYSIAPTKKVLSKGKYLINFIGDNENKLRIELFIIYYKDNVRQGIKSIPLNKYEVLTIPENEEVRIAIRIAGKGVLKFNSVQVFQLKDDVQEIATTKQVFDVEEYNWNITGELSGFELDSWYFRKSGNYNLSTTDENYLNINTSFSNKEYAYISYKELNIDFSKRPVDEVFEYNNDYIYKVEFNGDADDRIVELIVVYYDDKGKKEQVETIFLNDEKLIKPKAKKGTYRIALRLAGSGHANISSIKISRKKLIENLPFNQLRKIGFGKPKGLADFNLAVISDEFTTACLEPEANLIKFGPDDWQAVFEFNKPDMLFVESAWQGNDGKWTGKVAYKNETNTLQLQEIINWCREHDIKTVFWNKEDPVHFNAFIKTAKYFDYIFTTDEGSVENYKTNLNHDRVFALPFAAQPSMHNPIELYNRVDKACFAGSYYANKYLERQQDMNLLLETAATYGLEIYDRNYSKKLPEFYFPENLRKYVVGSLKSSEIDKAYKGYKIALNVNSVTESNTMFSRRVFECLASNTPVVSTYSKGISNLLGDTVCMATNLSDLQQIFNSLYNDQHKYEELAHKGYREVMQNHTYEKRLNFVLEKAGIPLNNKTPKVTVLSLVQNSNEAMYIVEQFEKQGYLNKDLALLVKDNKTLDLLKENENLAQLDIKTTDEYILSENLDLEIVSYFSPTNYYGAQYISDLMFAFKYTNAEIVGKYSYYHVDSSYNFILENETYSHKYVSELQFDKSLINLSSKKIINTKELIGFIEGNNLGELLHKGLRFYSSDKFNFIGNYDSTELNNKDIRHILV